MSNFIITKIKKCKKIMGNRSNIEHIRIAMWEKIQYNDGKQINIIIFLKQGRKENEILW